MDTTNNSTSSNTFSITPMSHSFSLSAGEQASGTITIINQSDSAKPFSFKVSVAPYGVKGNNYDADLVTETDLTQLAKWITIENPSGTIDPGKSEEVKFTINVPADAPGGGQYAAIVVSSDSQAEGSENQSVVEYVYEVASVIYGRIAGKTEHKGSILSHNVPGFSTTPKVSVNATIKNEGNVHEFANVSLTVTNVFTGEDIFSSEELDTPISEVIMPYSERYIVRNISNLPSLGVISIKETIKYLGETSTIEQNLIICPLWFLLLASFTIVAAVGTIIARARRRHNKSKRNKAED